MHSCTTSVPSYTCSYSMHLPVQYYTRTWQSSHACVRCLYDMCYSLPCSLSLHCKSRRRVDCFSVTSSKEGTLCELSVGGAQREEFSFEFLPFFAAELRWQVLMECDWETFVLLLTSLPLACAGLELWLPESGGTGMGPLLLIYFPVAIQNPP